jgi:hypothetical protein
MVMKNYTVRIGQPMAIEDDDEIAVAYMNGAMSGAEQLRFARLFANAPGMLEMLKDIQRDYEGRFVSCSEYDQDGHADDCKLAALFERIGDQQ